MLAHQIFCALGLSTLLVMGSFPADAHHNTNVDTRIVEPSGIQVFAHIPVAAGYEPVPTPQHCLEGAARLTGPFYTEDFEGTNPYTFQATPLSFTSVIRWQQTTFAGVGSDAGHSGTKRLYFGNPSTGNYNYNAHVAGTAKSPGIALPPVGPVYLEFATKWQVEWLKGYDHLWVEADTPDGKTHLLCTANAYDRADPAGGAGNTIIPSCSPFHATPCPVASLTAWEKRVVQIPSSMLGKTINLRFTFDTADDKANIYQGWMVDDVRLGTGLTP